jgi:fructose-1,6-bisphosphatase II
LREGGANLAGRRGTALLDPETGRGGAGRDRLETVFRSKDLARGHEILFAATGISDSPLLRGVEVHGSVAVTHSVLMRVKSGTVRYLRAEHNLEKKTIHLRSAGNEVPV